MCTAIIVLQGTFFSKCFFIHLHVFSSSYLWARSLVHGKLFLSSVDIQKYIRGEELFWLVSVVDMQARLNLILKRADNLIQTACIQTTPLSKTRLLTLPKMVSTLIYTLIFISGIIKYIRLIVFKYLLCSNRLKNSSYDIRIFWNLTHTRH